MNTRSLPLLKRSKPYANRASQLADWIAYELAAHKDAERFAIMGQRKTWELIRTALRKYAER